MQARRTAKQDEFDGCPCSGKNLSKLVQPSILTLLRMKPAHGYTITERIASLYEFPAGPPKRSAVYQLLKRMEADGLVRSHLEEAPAGPARRVYAITADGKACLERWRESLALHRRAIDTLLSLGHTSK